MSVISIEFAGQNWAITPAPLAVNEPPPSSISDQKWIVVASGVVITSDFSGGRSGQGVPGDNPHDWRRLTASFVPDIVSPMNYAIDRYGIPRPTNVPEYGILLSLDLWTPFVAVSSTVDTTGSPAGCAVDVWRPTHFAPASDLKGNPVPNAFSGIDADVAIFGGAILHRLSYQVTLVGKIVFGFLF